MNLDVVASSTNLNSLRQLYNQVESHISSLKSLGVKSESYGGLLTSVLLNKLPHDLQLLVSHKIGEIEWRLDEIMRAVEEEIQTCIAVASGPAGPVLAGPVFHVSDSMTARAQKINNKVENY